MCARVAGERIKYGRDGEKRVERCVGRRESIETLVDKDGVLKEGSVWEEEKMRDGYRSVRG